MDIWKEHCYQSIVAELSERFRLRDDAVMRILQERDTETVLSRSYRMRQKFMRAVDESFPNCDLNPAVTNRLVLDGYTIENVTIQTLPDVSLPINVYLPTKGTAPYPAIVVPIGHWLYGKAIPENQILCANLAIQGFVVATYDPVSQGERMIVEPAELVKRFGNVPEDLYSVGMHMIPGNLFYLLGKNLMSLFVHDGKRVLDYICSRTDVDPDRIGMTGQSGGGTQTTFLAALDDRVKAYSPVQCLSKQALLMPESGIGDCEQSLINVSADEGIDYSDILWAALPKSLMVSSGSKDYFPVEGIRLLEAEMSLAYKLLGRENDFSVCVADCAHEICAETRMYAYRWFNRVLRNDAPENAECEIAIQPMETLACIPKGTKRETPINAAYYLLEQARLQRPPTLQERRDALIAMLDVRHRRTTVENICGGNRLLHVEGARTVSYSDTETDRPVCIAITDDTALCNKLAIRYRLIQATPWGIETAYRKTLQGYDAETRLFNAAVVAGESIMADRVNQICALAEHVCRTSGQECLRLVGKGAGALIALLAAAVDECFEKAAILDYPLSIDKLFQHETYLLPETLILPGFSLISDVEDVFAMTNGRALGIHPDDGLMKEPRATDSGGLSDCVEDANAIFSFFERGRR